MRRVTCGLWPRRRGLAVAVVEVDGRVIWSGAVAHDDDAKWMLLSQLDAEVGLDYELVLPDWLARHDGVARFALARQVAVWTVPPDIVDAIGIVGRLSTGPPLRMAAALARLPLAPVLRGYLSRVAPDDRRQLSLL